MDINYGGAIGVAFFYLLILFVGLWAAWYGKKQRKMLLESSQAICLEEDQMLAGRNIGWIVGTFTMTATWVGGGYINGTTEAVYRPGYGLLWTQAPFGYALSLVFGGLLFAKPMRKRGYITMLDPFQEKYGKRMGGLLYIPALVGEVFWSGAILAALGSTIHVILGADETWSILISAAIALSYTMIGGLYSVAYTDVIQLICIFFGLWLCVPFAIFNPDVKSLTSDTGWLGTWDWTQCGVWIDFSLLLVFGGIPWQVYFQRVLAAKTIERAMSLSYFAAIGCIVMAIPAVLLGCAAYGVDDWSKFGYKDKSPEAAKEAKHVLPLTMEYLTPSLVSWCGLGAISAAVMSSADSSILSAASMFSRNIYKNLIRQRASEEEIGIVTKLSLLAVGILAAILALTIDSIAMLWILCSDLVYVILFPQLFCVIYFDFANTYGSLAAYIFGFSSRLLSGEKDLDLPAIIRFPFYDEKTKTQLFPFRTLLMVTSFLIIIGVSYVTKFLHERHFMSDRGDVFKVFEDKPLLSLAINNNITQSHSNQVIESELPPPDQAN